MTHAFARSSNPASPASRTPAPATRSTLITPQPPTPLVGSDTGAKALPKPSIGALIPSSSLKRAESARESAGAGTVPAEEAAGAEVRRWLRDHGRRDEATAAWALRRLQEDGIDPAQWAQTLNGLDADELREFVSGSGAHAHAHGHSASCRHTPESSPARMGSGANLSPATTSSSPGASPAKDDHHYYCCLGRTAGTMPRSLVESDLLDVVSGAGSFYDPAHLGVTEDFLELQGLHKCACATMTPWPPLRIRFPPEYLPGMMPGTRRCSNIYSPSVSSYHSSVFVSTSSK